METSRLRQARLAAGVTLARTAELLSARGVRLTRAALSKYECGKSVPPARVLIALASALGVTPDYFLAKRSCAVSWLGFRKHAALPKSLQERARARALNVVEEHVRLLETISPNERPSFPSRSRISSQADAESLAQRVRAEWNLGEDPLESVTQTIEDRGGVVVSLDFGDEKGFDGLSGWANDLYPVIVFNSCASTDRTRYNLCHELGHLAMDGRDAGIHDDEALAHRFAAAFLVPATSARKELGARRRHLKLAELRILKRKYGLSIQAWIRRALDLEIIDSAHATRLYRSVSALGWRTTEPDPLPDKEEPMKLRQLALRAYAEDLISAHELEIICPQCMGADSPDAARTESMATALLRMTPEKRDAALARAAEMAAPTYERDRELSELGAFDDDDLSDSSSEA